MIALGQIIKIAEKQSDDKKCIVTLQKNEHYFIKKTIYICRNMQIEGNKPGLAISFNCVRQYLDGCRVCKI